MRPLFSLVLAVVSMRLLTASQPTPQQQAILSHATRHEKHGWTYIHLEGDGRERGFQQGWLLAAETTESLRKTRIGWEHQTGVPWPWLVERAGSMFAPKIDPESLAEIDGIAEGLTAAGHPATRNELIVYNGIIELSGYWWPTEAPNLKDAPAPPVRESCSSFIATGSMTKDGNIVLGHNTMAGYADVTPNVIADIVPKKGHRILWQSAPGWIHSGTDFFMTDAGLVGSETTLGGFSGFDTNGIPEFVRMRRATQDAGSIDEWCEIMKKGNNGGYANAWMLGDINTKEIARLELGLKFIGFERTKDGYFTGSNIAEDVRILRFETSANDADIRSSAIARRVRWKQLMAQNKGKIDLKLARSFEADHYDAYLKKNRAGGRGLCGHFELDAEPAGPWPGVPYGCAGTLDGKVVDADHVKRLSFEGRFGSACGKAFSASQFLAAHPQYDWMQGLLRDRPSQPWTEFHAGE